MQWDWEGASWPWRKQDGERWFQTLGSDSRKEQLCSLLVGPLVASFLDDGAEEAGRTQMGLLALSQTVEQILALKWNWLLR